MTDFTIETLFGHMKITSEQNDLRQNSNLKSLWSIIRCLDVNSDEQAQVGVVMVGNRHERSP